MPGTVTKEEHDHQCTSPPKDVKNINCWQRADTLLCLTLTTSRDLITQLYPQSWEQGLAHSKSSINICRMNTCKRDWKRKESRESVGTSFKSTQARKEHHSTFQGARGQRLLLE